MLSVVVLLIFAAHKLSIARQQALTSCFGLLSVIYSEFWLDSGVLCLQPNSLFSFHKLEPKSWIQHCVSPLTSMTHVDEEFVTCTIDHPPVLFITPKLMLIQRQLFPEFKMRINQSLSQVC